MGPIPISSTLSAASWPLCAFSVVIDQVGHTLGGLVAGEGSFVVTRAGTFASSETRKKFVFQLTMASRDRPLLVALRDFLGVGSINDRPSGKVEWQPRSVLTVKSVKAHRASVIPFAEHYLPQESAKWRQFVSWHTALENWDAIHPALRVKGTCSEPDCDRPVRGQGVCRIHYYRLTGY